MSIFQPPSLCGSYASARFLMTTSGSSTYLEFFIPSGSSTRLCRNSEHFIPLTRVTISRKQQGDHGKANAGCTGVVVKDPQKSTNATNQLLGLGPLRLSTYVDEELGAIMTASKPDHSSRRSSKRPESLAAVWIASASVLTSCVERGRIGHS
jgi:hypothetical protein